MSKSRLALVPLLLALTACASPADVQADHDRTVRGYQDQIRELQGNIRHENQAFAGDVATAREWNQHFMGIPAAGWVAILILATIVVGIGVVVWMMLAHDSRDVRRQREHELALEREKTERARIKAADEVIRRGNCQVCNAAPVPDTVIAEVEKRDARS